MDNYTVVNLNEIEDQAPKFGYSPGLQARFARPPLECQTTGLSFQRLAPGFRMPFGHKHERQEEIYVLMSGSGRVKVEDEVVELKARDAVRVSAGAMRAFEAGPEGAEIVAFGAPATDDPASDAEMEPGWWSD